MYILINEENTVTPKVSYFNDQAVHSTGPACMIRTYYNDGLCYMSRDQKSCTTLQEGLMWTGFMCYTVLSCMYITCMWYTGGFRCKVSLPAIGNVSSWLDVYKHAGMALWHSVCTFMCIGLSNNARKLYTCT